MSKARIRVVNAFLVCCVAFMLVFMGIPVRGDDEPENVNVNIAPHRIILNAKCDGDLQDIQAIIRIVLSSPVITDFWVSLSCEGTEVDAINSEDDAGSLRYCDIDDNLLASFDREEIQNKVKELGIEGEAIFIVDGWVTTSDEVTRRFHGDDRVEILAPGKKK